MISRLLFVSAFVFFTACGIPPVSQRAMDMQVSVEEFTRVLGESYGNDVRRFIDDDSNSMNTFAAYGRTDLLDVMINGGIPVDYVGGYGKTALHSAFQGGSLPAARYLVGKGADMRRVDRVDRTVENGFAEPIWHAIDQADPALLDFALKNGARSYGGLNTNGVRQNLGVQQAAFDVRGFAGYADLIPVFDRYGVTPRNSIPTVPAPSAQPNPQSDGDGFMRTMVVGTALLTAAGLADAGANERAGEILGALMADANFGQNGEMTATTAALNGARPPQSVAAENAESAASASAGGDFLIDETYSYTCRMTGKTHTAPIKARTQQCAAAMRNLAAVFGCNRIDEQDNAMSSYQRICAAEIYE